MMKYIYYPILLLRKTCKLSVQPIGRRFRCYTPDTRRIITERKQKDIKASGFAGIFSMSHLFLKTAKANISKIDI